MDGHGQEESDDIALGEAEGPQGIGTAIDFHRQLEISQALECALLKFRYERWTSGAYGV